MKISVKFRKHFLVPSTGRFVQILHDFQAPNSEWNSQPRALSIGYNSVTNPTGSYPDTVFMPGMKPNDFYPLSREWQKAWFDLLNISVGNWQWLTRHGICFTDLHAIQQGYTDFVSGINTDSSKGAMQVKSLALGGNICKVIGEDESRYFVEAFDLTQPPPAIDRSETWRVHLATQSTVIEQNGSWQVAPFPQADGLDVQYFLPSIGGVNKLPKEWAQPIENGAVYSPYQTL